jgi:hypothetical protein
VAHQAGRHHVEAVDKRFAVPDIGNQTCVSRTRVSALALAITLFVVVVAPVHADQGQKTFNLDDIIPPKGDGDPLTMIVSTSGTPLDAAELGNKDNWRVGMVTDNGTVPVKVADAKWSAASKTGSLSFPRSATNNADLGAVGWVAVYQGSQLLTVSVDAESSGRFKAAKDKADAWFYAFGSVLVGPSTKPIYVVDLKVDYADQLGNSPWKWHVGGTATTNTDAEPPVDKVRIAPDALTAFLSFSKINRVKKPAWITPTC